MTVSLYVLPGEWSPGFAEGSVQQSLLDLITSEHAVRPKFMAVVQALTEDLVASQEMLGRLSVLHDIDVAVGAQLDEIGLWVGLSRYLPVPLIGVYFEWDGTALVGWDSGSWQGPFDPTNGLTMLPDDVYRQYLKAKVAANHWDGTLPGAYAALNYAFTGTNKVILTDYQNMRMSVSFYGEAIGAVLVALMTTGLLPLKPAGVAVLFYGVPINSGKLFAWDAEGDELAGWDEGNWVREIYPASDPLNAYLTWDSSPLVDIGWDGLPWYPGL